MLSGGFCKTSGYDLCSNAVKVHQTSQLNATFFLANLMEGWLAFASNERLHFQSIIANQHFHNFSAMKLKCDFNILPEKLSTSQPSLPTGTRNKHASRPSL